MRERTRATVTVLLFTLVGCAAGPPGPRNVDDLADAPPFDASDIVNVAISDADRTRVDARTGPFGKLPEGILTGPMWSRAFNGDPRDGPVFTITSGTVKEETSAFAVQARYIVDGVLSFGGHKYPIHAEGQSSTGGPPNRTIPLAVREGIVDAAHRVSAVVAANTDESRASGGSDKRTDIYTELVRLDDLRKKGIITDAEFQDQKRKLLDAK